MAIDYNFTSSKKGWLHGKVIPWIYTDFYPFSAVFISFHPSASFAIFMDGHTDLSVHPFKRYFIWASKFLARRVDRIFYSAYTDSVFTDLSALDFSTLFFDAEFPFFIYAWKDFTLDSDTFFLSIAFIYLTSFLCLPSGKL